MTLSLSLKTKVALGGALVTLVAVLASVALAINSFEPRYQPVGYVAQDQMTSFNLRSNEEYLFRGEYERETWSGGVLAYPADSEGNVDTAAAVWNAGEALDQQDPATDRFIGTMSSADGQPVAFTYATLSPQQKLDLNSSEALVNYLRGSRSGEGTVFRTRLHVLGGVIHSRPLYVPDDANPTLFVGANDGMLHAINATTPKSGGTVVDGGRVRWSYLPSMLIPKLKNLSVDPKLADPSTTASYVPDYYVDGQLNVTTLRPKTPNARRMLVGGLGAGGKGLFALDITGSAGLIASTDAQAAAKVVWEVTPTTLNYQAHTYSNPDYAGANKGFANLGYTYGSVILAKVPRVSGTGSVDAVIIGNGYNNGGDYGSYLFVIETETGKLLRALKAGTGTASSPNGLSTPVAVDRNNDGIADTVYAGDLNGAMWRFDLANPNDAHAVIKLIDTGLPITSTPGVALHPNGGFMVNFGTGRMLTPADADDATVQNYVYGVWDPRPTTTRSNTVVLEQAIIRAGTKYERLYGPDTLKIRARSVTAYKPNWSDGTSNHIGWRLALPPGERVVGEGSFIENGRFYFTTHNPTISTAVPNTDTKVRGENWLMELDYLSGGVAENTPFLDFSGDKFLTDHDRLPYVETDADAVADPQKVGKVMPSTDGIPVGKFISDGVMSQPILVQLSVLNDTLFNQNPDVLPSKGNPHAGVDGGHFDVDIFHGSTTSESKSARATITVGTTGQSSTGAILGAIKVDGVVIAPALTAADLQNGLQTANNAETITQNISGGFVASRNGNTVTIVAPAGAHFNGRALSIDEVQATAEAPSKGILVFTDAEKNRNATVRCGGTGVASSFQVADRDSKSARLDSVYNALNGSSTNGYAVACTRTQSGSSTTAVNCSVTPPPGASACTAGFELSRLTTSTNTGPQGGAAGLTNFKSALSTTNFAGGEDGVVAGDNCDGTTNNPCRYKTHIHQYDDKYDRTGVNFLNASNRSLNLVNMIPSATTQFKILVHNQYLNPAVKLHVGNPSYLFDVDLGYVSVKNYGTQSSMSVASLPTYVRAETAQAPVLPIGSLAVNMPTDALTAKNWWGNNDIRVGLHPTTYSCVWAAAGGRDGNMYQPVTPPENGVDGPGVQGWQVPNPRDPNSTGTTPATATGARHNGALTIQLIKANTPDAAVEMNVPGRSEYGWRVKSSEFAKYVLGEYSVYWHHPNEKCYHRPGWIKQPGPDDGSTKETARAAGSTDPKIGELGVGAGGVVSVTTTRDGNTLITTLTYATGGIATIKRTTNANGSVTIVTTDVHGVSSTQTLADAGGKVKTGGDESGIQATTGRISWRERVRQ